ncbi:MAG: segregation/condensation protein A, partial [Coleofasciculaceae cyanobacterium]
MTETSANQAIALLIDLAQRGEINPWDVQVIEVIDRYLSGLALDPEVPAQRDADLSQSGQAFLWASMLVLLKADTLARLGEPEVLEIIEEDEELDDGGGTRLPLHLERHLRRRAAAPPPKKRPVTLAELIEQLQQMAAQLGENNLNPRPKPPRAVSRTQTAQAIAHLAHDENLTEIAARLEVFLYRHWQQLSAGKDWLNLDQLLEWWTLPSVALDEASQSPGSLPNLRDTDEANADDEINLSKSGFEPTVQRTDDRVGVFWALLLLSAQSKVELSQEEFYQDLHIRKLP